VRMEPGIFCPSAGRQRDQVAPRALVSTSPSRVEQPIDPEPRHRPSAQNSCRWSPVPRSRFRRSSSSRSQFVPQLDDRDRGLGPPSPSITAEPLQAR
jgi:hypothetical protein